MISNKGEISVEFIGAKELERKLSEIEIKVSKKIVRQAVRKAQKIMLDVAKSYVSRIHKTDRDMAGKIKAALTVRAQKKQEPGTYSINVLMKPDPAFVHYRQGSFSYLRNKKGTGRGKTIGRTFAPAAIEYGHGRNKESAARPYMRPAGDATVGKRMATLVNEVNKGLAQIWNKK